MDTLYELGKVRRNLHTLENIINQQAAEIERLRAALKEIAKRQITLDAEMSFWQCKHIAREALKEKP